MNWAEAVAAMRAGHTVRRRSEMWRHQIADDIFENGEEGMRLMHAWTADEAPALIFVGALSKVLFVPEDEHRSATDWEIDQARAEGGEKTK